MTNPVTISAAGRTMVMTGTVQSYLDGHSGWNADVSAVFACTKDIIRGATVLDVGANIGMVSCTLAAQRPDLHIIAIEPVPQNVECLRANVANNGLTNVDVIHAAASDRPGKVRVNVNGPWSVVMDHGEAEVPAIAIDQFLDLAPAFVKIDVEGWEPYVLAGASKIMTSLRPKVFMELNSWCLLAARHDPWALSQTLWDSFDILEQFYLEQPMGAPVGAGQILGDNIGRFNGNNDILMRPKEEARYPRLEDMIFTPAHIAALHQMHAAA